MKNITMFTLFSGYESQMMGLLNAVKKFNNRFKAELVGWCEIDKAARLVHNLVFPEYADRCYPDVREIDWNKVSDFGRTRQTLWSAVQMLTQKLCCQTIHDCPKVVPLHYESE